MTIIIDEAYSQSENSGQVRQWLKRYVQSLPRAGLSYVDLARPRNMRLTPLVQFIRQGQINPTQ